MTADENASRQQPKTPPRRLPAPLPISLSSTYRSSYSTAASKGDYIHVVFQPPSAACHTTSQIGDLRPRPILTYFMPASNPRAEDRQVRDRA